MHATAMPPSPPRRHCRPSAAGLDRAAERTAPTWCALRSASCRTRRWPRTWCTTSSRPCCRGRAAFAGASALRSWLTGVLKHKIVDLVRQRRAMQSLDDEADDGEALALECPQPRPDELAEQRERLRQTLQRIDALPTGLRDVMRLRVLNDQPTEAGVPGAADQRGEPVRAAAPGAQAAAVLMGAVSRASRDTAIDHHVGAQQQRGGSVSPMSSPSAS